MVYWKTNEIQRKKVKWHKNDDQGLAATNVETIILDSDTEDERDSKEEIIDVQSKFATKAPDRAVSPVGRRAQGKEVETEPMEKKIIRS